MMLPPAYCITMRHTHERRMLAKTEFVKHGIDVEFVEGIDGREWGLTTRVPYEVDRGGSTPPGKEPYLISQSCVGLLLSFNLVWNLAKHAGHKEFIVFEDDVTPEPNFVQNFEQVRADLPDDWQFVFLGSVHGEKAPGVRKIKGRVHEFRFLFCTHALLVRQSALHVLLRTQSLAWAPADIQILYRALPALRSYAIFPPMATQKSLTPEYCHLKTIA